jgi:hypothetical protein
MDDLANSLLYFIIYWDVSCIAVQFNEYHQFVQVSRKIPNIQTNFNDYLVNFNLLLDQQESLRQRSVQLRNELDQLYRTVETDNYADYQRNHLALVESPEFKLKNTQAEDALDELIDKDKDLDVIHTTCNDLKHTLDQFNKEKANLATRHTNLFAWRVLLPTVAVIAFKGACMLVNWLTSSGPPTPA